jgi:hypothetical protein
MRFARPAVSLTAALLLATALVAGCGSVAAPKPDPKGDAAFVRALTKLCSKAPPLAPIDTSSATAAITAAADADGTTVDNLGAGLAKLTPSLSSASPLAPTIINLALMLADTGKWYENLTNYAKLGKTSALDGAAQLAVMRATQARADLTKLGVTSCLS